MPSFSLCSSKAEQDQSRSGRTAFIIHKEKQEEGERAGRGKIFYASLAIKLTIWILRGKYRKLYLSAGEIHLFSIVNLFEISRRVYLH